MIRDKNLKQLARHARAQGWKVEPTGSHLKWLPPEGPFVISSATPSDGRALKNLRSDLRRHGLEGI